MEDQCLKTLHSRLQDETDKIYRFQISAEMELSQKEKALADGKRIHEVLQKNLIEEQLRSEHLSFKLEREKDRRKQVTRQISTTRLLIDSLKERQDSMEMALQEHDSIRTCLKLNNETLRDEVDQLSTQFSELGMNHTNIVNEITMKSETKISKLEEKNNILLKDLQEADANVTRCEDAIGLLTEAFFRSSQKVFTLEENLEKQEARKNWELTRRKKVQSSLATLKESSNTKILELEGIVEETKSQMIEESQRLNESRSALTEAAEKLESLSRNCSILQGERDEIQQKLEALKPLKEEIKSLKSSKKSLDFEIKKNEKLKTRLENVQTELKERKTSLKDKESMVTELEDKNMLLKNEIDELQKKAEEKDKELSELTEKSHKVECSLRKDLLEANRTNQELIKAAEASRKDAESAQTKASIQIKEMVHLCEIWKQEQSETAVSNPPDTPSQPQPKPVKQIYQSPDENHKPILEANLRTPSPSQYLQFIKPNVQQSANQSLSTKPQSTWKRSILKSKGVKTLESQNKKVTFKPQDAPMPDSDSSDGLAVEVGSDTDDRFEAVRRSSQPRMRTFDPWKHIPKANILPFRKEDLGSNVRLRSSEAGPANRQPNSKRAKYDKTALKTYSSPRSSTSDKDSTDSTNKENQPENQTHSRHDFDKIFEAN